MAKLLKERKKTVSLAESCTGGLITHKLTNIPGSSAYLICSIVAYNNKIKVTQLKVPKKTLTTNGAVSEETALIMAKNIRKISQTDFGVSTTGIAGPSGATKNKPVGLVYIAASSKRKTICRKFKFKGSRLTIKAKTAEAALNLLKELIKKY